MIEPCIKNDEQDLNIYSLYKITISKCILKNEVQSKSYDSVNKMYEILLCVNYLLGNAKQITLRLFMIILFT